MISINQMNLAVSRPKALAVLLCACAAAGIAHAKTIDYTPDLASRDYWDSHHIAAVRVTAVHNEDSAGYLTCQVESRFSDDAVEAIRNLPFSHLWFGSDEQDAPQIGVDDRFVVFYSREGPSPVVVTPLAVGTGGSRGTGSRLLETLRGIARLRENPGEFQSYLNAVVGAASTVARYSLRYLLSQPATVQASGDYQAKLLAFRNDSSRETEDRILAGRLAYRLDGTEGSSGGSDEEYSWLQASLAASQSRQWTELTPFVDRLLEFAGKRAETIAFLTQLASSPAVAPAVRIAAYGAFPDPRLFHFEQPDSESARIYQTCVGMLSDPDPTLRPAAAALLHNITLRVNATDRPGYVLRSRGAISQALTAESDEVAQFHLNRFLKLLAN
jgi:hypothetical protein